VATYTKFNLFTDDLLKGTMNFSSDNFRIMLTNVAPVATNHTFGDLTEITAGNGYTAGGQTSAITIGNVTGTETVTAAAVTWTATGGSIGPLRYAAIYDNTSTPKTLIAWFDYASSITLATGETFTVEPNSSATTGTLFTLV
jgi:hypothetical protein